MLDSIHVTSRIIKKEKKMLAGAPLFALVASFIVYVGLIFTLFFPLFGSHIL